jgi:Flp pilus assembly protein TadD
MGQVYIELGKDDEAIKTLQRAIALNPKNADAHVNLGGLYDAMGETAKATASYKMYLLLEPNGRFAADIRKLMSTRR